MDVKIGDRVVVYRYGHEFPITVKDIVAEPGGTRLVLDWGEFGSSKVWLHDQGSVWQPLGKVS